MEKEEWKECKQCGEMAGLIEERCFNCYFDDPKNAEEFIRKLKSGEIKVRQFNR